MRAQGSELKPDEPRLTFTFEGEVIEARASHPHACRRAARGRSSQ